MNATVLALQAGVTDHDEETLAPYQEYRIYFFSQPPGYLNGLDC